MFMWLKDRGHHTKAIGKSWWFLVATAWAVFWAVDASIEKWDVFGTKIWWEAHTTHLPAHWQEWLLGILVLTIIGLIDGSYRHHKHALEKAHEGHATELKKTTNELATARTEIARLTEIPDIKGEILVVFWEVYRDPNETPWSKHSRYYIKLRLVNYNDVPCTINRYSVRVASFYDDNVGEGEGNPSPIGKLSHPTYNYTDESTEVVRTSTTTDTWTWTKPINITTQWPLARGRKQEGWVTFDVWNYKPQPIKPDDVAPETFLAHWQQDISVCVTDSLGNLHGIRNILADVSPARFERN